ncbi:MAG: hypothetical protein M0C28_34065 [Candidatus Moduliflexus flocculans]|nr:hypothetical protein [Candidatus Moduliflexus flocculans]
MRSLGGRFSPRAMSVIIQANVGQDRLAGQVGHDEFHFDNNAFEKTYAYIEEQRALVVSSLKSGDANSAWQAFGRFLHSAQDFYAHSNYITLWVSSSILRQAQDRLRFLPRPKLTRWTPA